MASMLSSWSHAQPPPFLVVIDPGHGGHDSGATRDHGKESDIVLKISEHLKRLLDQDPEFKTRMTRTGDEFVPLTRRAEFANSAKADLFLSVHVNSSPDVRAKGLEVYIQNQLPPDEESMYLANIEHEGHVADDRNFVRNELEGIPDAERSPSEVQNILKDMVRSHRIRQSAVFSKNIYFQWQGAKKSRSHSILQTPFFVVSNVNMPSALVELGFVSNPDDASQLMHPQTQKQMARNLYEAVKAYKDSVDKSLSAP